MRNIRFPLLLVLIGLAAMAPLSAQTTPPAGYHVVGYFISWGVYERGYHVSDIPADMLTHINYAFVNVSADGECLLGDAWADTQIGVEGAPADAPYQGNFYQLNQLKAAHPHLQTMISIGGWTWSARFSDVALTAEARARFAASCVAFMAEYGFDGIDLDWEYPTGGGNTGNIERPQDPENFVLLLAELRAQLDAHGATTGRHHPLTIAAGAGQRAYAGLDWERIHPLLDFINVMAYDMSGPWSGVTGFNAPLYDSTANPPEGASVNRTLSALLALGVPPEKLVLGAPFYGYGWAGVPARADGLHQPFDGLAPGRWAPGVFAYNELAETQIPTMTRHWDATAQVPWLFDAATGVMITYDDPESLAAKAGYVRANGLGGVMFWELSQDTPDSALLTALTEALAAP